MSYESTFGADLSLNNFNYSKYDLNYDYLLLNSEFEFDSLLNGFVINAIRAGNVNLKVFLEK